AERCPGLRARPQRWQCQAVVEIYGSLSPFAAAFHHCGRRLEADRWLMIKTPRGVAFLWNRIRKCLSKTCEGTGERDATPAALRTSETSSQTSVKSWTDDALDNFIPPWMFWMAMLLVAPQALCAAERTDPTLVPSIFAPESAPAHSISQLAGF